jgi:hypothetical protein
VPLLSHLPAQGLTAIYTRPDECELGAIRGGMGCCLLYLRAVGGIDARAQPLRA